MSKYGVTYILKTLIFLGELVDSLQANEMYENSIIVFVSDNGGNYRNGGASNYPLAQGNDY